MEENESEISVREIVDKLWDGKWIISVITIVALLIAGIYSYFIADPVYSGKALVNANNISTVPENIQPFVNEFTKPASFEQTMKSTTVLEKLIEQEELNSSVGKLESTLNIALPARETDTLISVSMNGTDRDEIKSIVDSAIDLTIEEMKLNMQSRLTLLEEQYQNNMVEESKNIDNAVKEFNDLSAGEGLPALLLFQQSNLKEQYILETNEEMLNELKDIDKADQVSYQKINSEIENLTSLYSFYSSKYDEVKSVNNMDIIKMNLNVQSETFVADQPLSPNKSLNMLIALVFGLILGIVVVVLRDFFIKTTRNKKIKITS